MRGVRGNKKRSATKWTWRIIIATMSLEDLLLSLGLPLPFEECKGISTTRVESALFTRNRCLRDWTRKKSFHFPFNDKEDESFVLLRDGWYNCWNQRSFTKMEGWINFRIENSWISDWLIENKLTVNPLVGTKGIWLKIVDWFSWTGHTYIYMYDGRSLIG